jgi:hypothetical protein
VWLHDHVEVDVAGVRACPCLAAQPEFAAIDIDAWRAKHRALLERAAFVIAPSSWAASILRRYFPEHEVRVIPHGSTNGISRADAIRAPLPIYSRVSAPSLWPRARAMPPRPRAIQPPRSSRRRPGLPSSIATSIAGRSMPRSSRVSMR